MRVAAGWKLDSLAGTVIASPGRPVIRPSELIHSTEEKPMRIPSTGLARLLASIFWISLLLGVAPAHALSTLKVVTQSDLKVLDPIWTPAYIVRNHGLMIYDVLFAMDEKGQVQPQMVDTWTVSKDQLVWTFTLRDGLAFHDGQPVTSADVIASLQRWAAKDGYGRRLFASIAETKAIDPKTFRFTFTQPYGLVLETLGKSGGPAFIMPQRVAATPPDQQIKEFVGSGPFIFQAKEWQPGVKVVYLKNPNYKPRADAPHGLAGAKVPKVDRVEWVSMPDAQTAANALLAGEVDLIESPPADLLPMLQKGRDVALFPWDKVGAQYWMVFNHTLAPFNDKRVRRAALLSIGQQDVLEAQVGDPASYTVCSAPLMCNSPYAKTYGDLTIKPNVAEARKLLKEANYDGTPVMVMSAADFPTLSQVGPVVKQQLEAAGFKVNLQSMDWQSILSRRTKKDPVAQGGWNMFFTRTAGVDVNNPYFNPLAGAACDKAYFGWPCDADLEALRERFATTPDKAQQQKIGFAIQDRIVEQANYGWLGEARQIGAYRKDRLSGWLSSPALVLWNIEKK